jgi:hypothetical protein
MRAVTMRSMSGGALAALVMLLAACGQQGSGRPESGRAVSSTVRCITPRLTGTPETLTLTDADNGKAFCVPAGTGIYVFLHGSAGHMWSHLQPTSRLIAPRPSGVMSLARGVTGGFFGVSTPGKASLISTRSCRPKGNLHTSRCAQADTFRVTIVVLP